MIQHNLVFILEEVKAMPTYEFKCDKCNKKFSLVLSISEYEKTKFRCPKCKSTKVRQLLTPFQVQTSKKS